MRILHISTGFNLDYNGGITNYVRCIAEQQAQNGHEVFVLSDGGTKKTYNVIEYRSNVAAWAYFKGHDKKGLDFIKQTIEKFNFDIIHIHMMLNIDQDLYQVLKGYNYVVSLHDYYFICPRIQMMNPLQESRCERANTESCYKCFSVLEKNWFICRATRKIFGNKNVFRFALKSKKVYKTWFEKNKELLENAKMLFPVSYRVEQIYKNSGIKNEYHVLHIGNISAEEFDNVKTKACSDEINLVILSNVSKTKGGPLFFSILRNVNNPLLRVHFWGRSNASDKKIFKSLGIIDHGAYTQTELSNILSKMDMGVMTPIWEDNGPQVVMEMLNNHLPIFGTRMGGITDFVNNNNGYLFDPYNEEEIREAIKFLNNLDRNIVDSMRNNIIRTLTPDEHYKELMEYYTSITCHLKV